MNEVEEAPLPPPGLRTGSNLCGRRRRGAERGVSPPIIPRKHAFVGRSQKRVTVDFFFAGEKRLWAHAKVEQILRKI